MQDYHSRANVGFTAQKLTLLGVRGKRKNQANRNYYHLPSPVHDPIKTLSKKLKTEYLPMRHEILV